MTDHDFMHDLAGCLHVFTSHEANYAIHNTFLFPVCFPGISLWLLCLYYMTHSLRHLTITFFYAHLFPDVIT